MTWRVEDDWSIFVRVCVCVCYSAKRIAHGNLINFDHYDNVKQFVKDLSLSPSLSTHTHTHIF